MEGVVDFVDEDEVSGGGDIYNVEFSSIDVVINCIKVYTGAKEMDTENGKRALIAYSPCESGDTDPASAFFTESKKLKDVALNPGQHYPFRAIIKIVRYGDNCGFKFFPPTSQITQADIDNFNYYRRNKFRHNK